MVQAGTTDRITPLLHQYYVSRLRSDLSRWVEQGWVKREDMDSILKDAVSSDRAPGSLPNLLALLGAVLVAALIALIAEGYRRDDRFAVNLGFVAFALTILRLYFDTFWLLFDRSLFFMVGGLLVIALGWGLERKRRNLIGDLGEAA